MQIVLVADHASINGGQAKVVVESALGLAARGHAVTVFAAVGPADPRLAAAGVAVVLTDQADVTSTNSQRPGFGLAHVADELGPRPAEGLRAA